jgi:hypothetical protein
MNGRSGEKNVFIFIRKKGMMLMMTIGFEISTHFFFDLKFFKEIFEKIKFV